MDAYSYSRSVRRTPSSTTLPVLPSSSKPMFIPSRRPLTSGGRSPGRRHAGVPPAVAALLAVTAIPPPLSKRRTKGGRRRGTMDSFENSTSLPSSLASTSMLDDDASSIDLPRNSSRATLSALLCPPDDYDAASMERSNSDGRLSVRSTSTESVPSLETDDEDSTSCSSNVARSPWSPRRRANFDSRTRIVSSPPEECHFDHPLMFSADEDVSQPEASSGVEFPPEDMLKRAARRLNLKSNLTASLRVLKSAAKSFSSLSASAAALQPDDYLTRSILSITPQYTDEKRPLPCEHEPTPALRRYLNPFHATYDDAPCTGAIQMQTYNSSRPFTSSDEEMVAASQLACGPVVRPREIRENPDFLRVIVLEMNMRRGGKLSDSAQGKARLVLPPRQPGKMRVMGNPGRWEALACVYEDE